MEIKTLTIIRDKQKRQVWRRAFHMWQIRPYEVAPDSEDQHTCASCATVFQGNYCPRCGQSWKVGRFSVKGAFQMFLDVWGFGNRGMFHSLRDLVLRPGYMIRDYLQGKRSAYFPPFKMFFILAALSLLVEHGFSLTADERETAKTSIPSVEQTDDRKAPKHIKELSEEEIAQRAQRAGMRIKDFFSVLKKKNPSVFSLLGLICFSLPLYFFFRHSPNIPDFRFSEFVVALVYTSNCFSIYSILAGLLHSRILDVVSLLMIFVAFHQLSGYSKKRVFGYIVATLLISCLSALILIILAMLVMAFW